MDASPGDSRGSLFFESSNSDPVCVMSDLSRLTGGQCPIRADRHGVNTSIDREEMPDPQDWINSPPRNADQG